jgi:hypothetical protein
MADWFASLFGQGSAPAPAPAAAAPAAEPPAPAPAPAPPPEPVAPPKPLVTMGEIEAMTPYQVVKTLDEAITTTPDINLELIEGCCRRLRVLCRDPENCKSCDAAGTAAAVVQAMQTLPQEANVQLQALAAVVNLCSGEANEHRKNAVEAGAMMAIIAAMNNLRPNAEVRASNSPHLRVAMAAARRLSRCAPSLSLEPLPYRRRALGGRGSRGAAPAAQPRARCTSARVCRPALRGPEPRPQQSRPHRAHGGARTAAAHAGACRGHVYSRPRLTHRARATTRWCVQVQEMACIALQNCCYGEDENAVKRRRTAGEHGALEAVITAMKTHSDSAPMQEVGCATLRLVVHRVGDLRQKAIAVRSSPRALCARAPCTARTVHSAHRAQRAPSEHARLPVLPC